MQALTKITFYLVVAYYVVLSGVAFAQEGYPATQPDTANVVLTKGSDISPDVIIKTKLQTIYSLNPVLNKFNLNVDVAQGIVHLDGALQNNAQKDLAISIAKNVEGVKDVTNSLVIDSSTKAGEVGAEFGQKIIDATLTAMVKSKLLLNPKTSGLNINVTTVNGIVTLSGTVSSVTEKELAGRTAIKTTGVDTVKNNLKVIKKK